MKRLALIIAVVFQVLVLATMVLERETVLRTGRTLYLATRPVDPRDPFRGDYVRLDYEISEVSSNDGRGAIREWMAAAGKPDSRGEFKGRRIYAALEVDADGVGRLKAVYARPPPGEVYIRGRIAGLTPHRLQAKYGIEAYFVEQGQGRPIEDNRRRPDGIRIPLEMDLALSGNGIAVLKGHRWSRLGIGLAVETNAMRRPVAVTVTLANVSERPLAIIDSGGGRNFELLPDLRWMPDRAVRWVGRDGPPDPVTDGQVVVLAPNEKHAIRVDLQAPEWWVVTGTNPPAPLSETADFQRWRLVYAPPAEVEIAQGETSAPIWHGRLTSPAFWGGGID
jgi:uncharacterized membrane-anchored protein